MTTCREEVIAAAADIGLRSSDGSFTPDDVVREMSRRGTHYLESTIRTHVVSVMCVDAPVNHLNHTDEIERVGRGRYRLRVDPTRRERLDALIEPDLAPVATVDEQVLDDLPSGNSEVQRLAEGEALQLLAECLSLELKPERTRCRAAATSRLTA